jgi:hypothetical protein
MTAVRDASLLRSRMAVDRSIDETCVTVAVEAAGPARWSETVSYRVRGPGVEDIEPTGDVALATWLLPAMRSATRLEIDSQVSAQLTHELPGLQATYAGWQQDFAPVEVCAVGGPEPQRQSNGVALFFSGGVDAFYTLLTSELPLTHLVFVAGFDFDERLARRSAEAIANASAVANQRDLDLLVVNTDVRTTIAGRDWRYTHGTTLFAIAHCLRGLVGTCLVSANDTRETVVPWGTHPDVDPFWSTESVRLKHSGFDVSRWDKLRVVGSDPQAKKHLRVCTDTSADAFNCGHCNKCVSTAFALCALGELDSVETLASNVSRREVMRISTKSRTNTRLLNECATAFDGVGNSRMARLARRTLAPPLARRAVRRCRQILRRITNATDRQRGRR